MWRADFGRGADSERAREARQHGSMRLPERRWRLHFFPVSRVAFALPYTTTDAPHARQPAADRCAGQTPRTQAPARRGKLTFAIERRGFGMLQERSPFAMQSMVSADAACLAATPAASTRPLRET